MLKSYKYRLLPTEDQANKFTHHFNCCRFIYNLALEVKSTAWKSAGKTITAYDLMRQVTELKNNECQWLNDCLADSLQSAIKNMDSAYKSFFRTGNFPKYKRHGGRQSYHIRQGCRIDNNFILIPKIGLVSFIKHREPSYSEIRTVTVSKEPTGIYFVSILVKTNYDVPKKEIITEDSAIGVDVGLKSFAVLSDGQIIESSKFFGKQLARLRIEQRTLRRRFNRESNEQSKGYYSQKLVVAKLHAKIRNQRNDFLHKITHYLTTTYNTICVEDLNVAGMMKNQNLAKAIQDVGWFEFARQLKYKAEWKGKNVVAIGRFEPSSKTCSECGVVNKELSLADREWTCEGCGVLHDRDLNAAINIKKMGLALILPPPPVEQKLNQ